MVELCIVQSFVDRLAIPVMLVVLHCETVAIS